MKYEGPSAFQTEVGRLTANGGGDNPESSLDALELAAIQPFRPKATKVILIITDAEPKPLISGTVQGLDNSPYLGGQFRRIGGWVPETDGAYA